LDPTNLPLRDIHLPDSISWWPLAVGWWLVLGIALLIILSVFILFKIWSRKKLRRQASKVLDQIEQSLNETGNFTQCLSELSTFLRRVVISQEMLPHSAAGLTGEDWLSFLDKRFNLETAVQDGEVITAVSRLKGISFSQGVGRILLHGPYQPTVEREKVTQLIELCRKWVKCL